MDKRKDVETGIEVKGSATNLIEIICSQKIKPNFCSFLKNQKS